MFRRRLLSAAAAVVIFGAGMLAGAHKFGEPKSVVHVITLKWKDGITDAEKKSAMDAMKKLAGAYPGIKNIWLKTLKVQPSEYQNAFVMEFTDQAAFTAYTDAPAHKDFEKVYLPLRGQSTTSDITNE